MRKALPKDKPLTKKAFERLLDKAAQPIKKPSPSQKGGAAPDSKSG